MTWSFVALFSDAVNETPPPAGVLESCRAIGCFVAVDKNSSLRSDSHQTANHFSVSDKNKPSTDSHIIKQTRIGCDQKSLYSPDFRFGKT